jgi:16S rRNA (cytidine1402-2'-O)-methyltransferase
MTKENAKLVLVPTPIEEIGEIAESLKEELAAAFARGDCLVVEDPKPSRRRWIGWGLDRGAVDSFIHYNEHTRASLDSELLNQLKAGKSVYLMSDGGLPGFCDPGRSLIYGAHLAGIQVTMLAFPNSLLSAVTLSGFTEGAFEFYGFPPKDREQRKAFFKGLATKKGVNAFMDTPYRLERVLEECLRELSSDAMVSLAMDIGRETERIIWGKSPKVLAKVLREKPGKREFVLVVKI